MSQEQRQGPQEDQSEPVKYADVFVVSGDLAAEPIAPQDAAMMQRAENIALGQTHKGGAAAVMQSAAARNERAGLVGHTDVSRIPGEEGVSVTETDLPGLRIVTEAVGSQVVEQNLMTTSVPTEATAQGTTLGESAVTIGEALEASALTAEDKPVDHSDAAAIQAAEYRATGFTVPGGIAAEAQAAADANTLVLRDEEKTRLSDVLTDATSKLAQDKAVTREDAKRVMGVEMKNDPNIADRDGVAAYVAAAARLNQKRQVQ